MNFTRTPNNILDVMGSMKEAELRVTLALVRQTHGYHRKEAKMKISEIMEATGLSKQGVRNGTKDVLKRGFFCKGEGQSDWQIVNLVDYLENENSQLSDPEKSTKLTQIVNLVDPNSQLSDPSTSSPKENFKENFKETLNKGNCGFAEIVTAYENNIGLITKAVSDKIDIAIEDFNADWIIEAIEIAAIQNKRNWAYVNGILKRWKVEGKTSPKQNLNGKVTVANDAAGGLYV